MSNKIAIRNIAKVTNGKSDVKDAIDNGKYVFFDRSTLIKKSDKYLFDSEAIIIAGEDSRQIFEPRYFSGKFNLHQRCYVIYDFSENFFPKYLFYKLKTLTKHFANVNVGSTVPSLRLDHITDLKIDFPNYASQKSIAKVLSDLDAKIELNNRINRELEAMAKTLYDYWFVQFDFPNEQGKPYKSSGGKMVYNAELKREIPEGWEVKKLGECIKIFDSQRIPLSNKERELKKGKIPYYGATGIMDYVNDFIFNDDYILLAEDGSVMNEDGFPIIQFIWGKTWVNNHAHVIQSKDKEQNEFYYQHLSMIPVILIKTGSIQMKINQDNLKNYHIIVPPNNLINRYSRFANATRKSLINNIEQNQHLTALRDWLLPMLMNGQVRVKEAEERLSLAAEPSVEYKKG